MRLKSLEIRGFKSFADETVIHFNESITGIVGPNGSGKSNIVDAIRWVLGEQKGRELRLAQMSDVIFNGTKEGKRLLYLM
ncbi:MAG: AAA family ATPase [Saprospiraceae bacterium]|nr:AAA family ATPase [Saprospiraceae bacterium]